jgi:redox-sensitive bicupin YhaK (pirin superfamily)
MITLRPAAERGLTRLDWLDSRHTFSFNGFYDPRYVEFRGLRVINDDRIAPGEIQRMSAGTGIRHSEYDHSSTEPVGLLQIWIRPERRGIEPGYEQRKFEAGELENRLCPIAALNARVYAARLDAGRAAAVRSGLISGTRDGLPGPRARRRRMARPPRRPRSGPSAPRRG